MAYGNFKNLTRRKASDKALRDKAFNIAKNTKYDEYQRSLASVVYKFFGIRLVVAILKMRIFQTKSWLKDYANQLLENSKK